MCVLCPVVGAGAGCLAELVFGVNSPKSRSEKTLSSILTASAGAITLIALKTMWNISFCGDGRPTLANISRVGGVALLLGVIYSIGVNYVLNRYGFFKPFKHEGELRGNGAGGGAKSCCCQRNGSVEGGCQPE